MVSIEDLATYIENVQNELAARRYDEALTLYYAQLDKPLYRSGQNKRIVELLGAFLGRDNKPLTSIDRSLQERLSRSLSEAYRITGEPNNSIALLQWLLDSYNDKDNHRIRSIIMRYLSRIMLSLGRLKIAEEHIRAGIELCREAGEFGLETGLHRQLGILFTYAGRYKEARTELSSLPKSFGKHSHSDLSVYTDKCIHALQDKKERSKAIYYANEMKKLTQKYPYINDKVTTEWLLGLSYLQAGDLSRAEVHINDASTYCKEACYVELEPDILLSKARWYFSAKKNIHVAVKTAKDALAIASKCGYKLKQADILGFLGELALTDGDRSVAEKYALAAFSAAWCDGPPHYYKRALLDAKVILEKLNVAVPIRYSSCFISYNHQDKDFAHKLYNALTIRDIVCWLDEHKILPGDYFLGNIDEGIKKYDKVLLCCSKNSLRSFWVDAEIEKAVQKEKQLWDRYAKRTLVMIPLDLDGFLHKEWDDPKATMLRSRLSADFTDWDNNEQKFQDQFEKVLSALRIVAE